MASSTQVTEVERKKQEKLEPQAFEVEVDIKKEREGAKRQSSLKGEPRIKVVRIFNFFAHSREALPGSLSLIGFIPRKRIKRSQRKGAKATRLKGRRIGRSGTYNNDAL